MNIVKQNSKITLFVENKSSQKASSDSFLDEFLDDKDSDYALLSVYETSENPLIRELVGTYKLDSSNLAA